MAREQEHGPRYEEESHSHFDVESAERDGGGDEDEEHEEDELHDEPAPVDRRLATRARTPDATPSQPSRPYLQELFSCLDGDGARCRLDACVGRMAERHELLRGQCMQTLLTRFYEKKSGNKLDIVFRDALLTALIPEHHAAPGSAASDVLLRLVLPALSSVARKWKLEETGLDRDDIASYCVLAFVEALGSHTLQGRTRSLLPKIESLIRDQFRKWNRRIKKEREIRRQASAQLPLARRISERMEAAAKPGVLGVFCRDTEKPAPLDPDEIDAAFARFDRDVPPGLVSAGDRELIVRARACGEKVVRIAPSLGLKPATASKRMERALKRIQKRLKNTDAENSR